MKLLPKRVRAAQGTLKIHVVSLAGAVSWVVPVSPGSACGL